MNFKKSSLYLLLLIILATNSFGGMNGLVLPAASKNATGRSPLAGAANANPLGSYSSGFVTSEASTTMATLEKGNAVTNAMPDTTQAPIASTAAISATNSAANSQTDSMLNLFNLYQSQATEIRAKVEQTIAAIQFNRSFRSAVDCSGVRTDLLTKKDSVPEIKSLCDQLIQLSKAHDTNLANTQKLAETIRVSTSGQLPPQINTATTRFKANFSPVVPSHSGDLPLSQKLVCLNGMTRVEEKTILFCMDTELRKASNITDARKTCSNIIDQRGFPAGLCTKNDYGNTYRITKAKQLSIQDVWTDYGVMTVSGTLDKNRSIGDLYAFKCCEVATSFDFEPVGKTSCTGSWGTCQGSADCSSPTGTQIFSDPNPVFSAVDLRCPNKNGDLRSCNGGSHWTNRSYLGASFKAFIQNNPNADLAANGFSCTCPPPYKVTEAVWMRKLEIVA
jgi:hypothetical protein